MIFTLFLCLTGCSSGGTGGATTTEDTDALLSGQIPTEPERQPAIPELPLQIPAPGDAQPPDPGTTPPGLSIPCNALSADMKVAMLALFNEARSTARSCGTASAPAVNALTWNSVLEEAAANHSLDMATQNFFDHTGSDGLSVVDRVSALGYQWSTVSENIAAGQSSAQDAVQAWLDSPGHCANLMRGASTEFAVSCRSGSTAQYGSYWTAVFAAPR